ncbi:MAG: RNA polymerase sigma factor, partial [Gemmatimonadales bacterium]
MRRWGGASGDDPRRILDSSGTASGESPVAHAAAPGVTHPTPVEWAALSDQEVVRHAARGREAAYRELIRRYQRPVFSLIYRMVRDRELAEDLAQETFVKVLNAIESYRPEYKFSSWIFKIANNAAIDQLRRRSLDTISLDGSPHAATAEAIEATTLQIGD